MKLHPRVTRSALDLVKRFEGLRRRAARLPDGGWTVGYGHTRSAREGAVVSPEDADALLYYDLSEVAEKVEAWTFTPLNQNQFEALTAFTFNIGVDNFRRSTVLKRVNEGQHLMAAAALELWRKADFGGEDVVIDALVRRRAAEKAHYLTPPEGFRPSPTPVLKPTYDHSVIEAAANARAGRDAAVVDAPMDGEQATVTLAPRTAPADAETGPFPYVAAATGMATARLHQLFPDKAVERSADGAPVPPFALESERDAADQISLKAVNDGPFGPTAATETASSITPTLDVPATPMTQPTSFSNGFAGFTSPPNRSFQASPSFDGAQNAALAAGKSSPTTAEPPLAPATVADHAPLFDAPSPRAAFSPIEDANGIGLRDDEPIEAQAYGDHTDHSNAAEIVNGHEPGPLHNRSMIYFSVGLLGVALFAAALFSMFSGKASPVNLVIGLMGILFMTPAGGYFLLRFLNQRDGLVEL